MEQLTEQLTIRMSVEDMELLKALAADQKRSVAWVARETIRSNIQN